MTVVRFPTWAENFFPGHRIQTSSGARPSSYPVSTGGSFFPRSKAVGA